MPAYSMPPTWKNPFHKNYEQTLKIAASRWFASHGCATRPDKTYVLARKQDWPKNLILSEVADSVLKERHDRSGKVGFLLHQSIHSGISSQAMLINLVGPLIVRRDLEPLKVSFELGNIPWPYGEIIAGYEYENRQVFNEVRGQPTSVDLVLAEASGKPRVFIEAKLAETGFGGCSIYGKRQCDGRSPAGDFSLCYLHRAGRRYWQLLEKYGFLEGPIGRDSTCILAVHYQFFREVLFALELGGSFVLLYDQRNPTFKCDGPFGERGLMPLLLSFVPTHLRPRVSTLTIQQVVAAIKHTSQNDWISEFESKYALKP